MATGFNNYVQPLIRYRTGDYAVYEEAPHSCGYAGRVLERIESHKLIELLITSEGNEISMSMINFHSDIFDHVGYYQFYQPAKGKVTMRIVKGRGYGPADERAIKRAVSEKLGPYIDLSIDYVEQVEKSRSGKYRYVISEIL